MTTLSVAPDETSRGNGVANLTLSYPDRDHDSNADTDQTSNLVLDSEKGTPPIVVEPLKVGTMRFTVTHEVDHQQPDATYNMTSQRKTTIQITVKELPDGAK